MGEPGVITPSLAISALMANTPTLGGQSISTKLYLSNIGAIAFLSSSSLPGRPDIGISSSASKMLDVINSVQVLMLSVDAVSGEVYLQLQPQSKAEDVAAYLADLCQDYLQENCTKKDK